MPAALLVLLSSSSTPLIVLSLSSAGTPPTCSADWQSCTDAPHCCASHSYACYHRTDRQYAQCRPRRQSCQDDETWVCPGWEAHVGDVPSGGDCFGLPARGCRALGEACFKRVGVEYAQCRPLPRNTICVDTADWICPASWSSCSSAGEACTESRCCADASEACYKRPYAHFAQCRQKVVPCIDSHSWLCPGSEGRSIGLGRWEECAQPWQTCLESACCSARTFGCYKRVGRSYAQCKPLTSPLGGPAQAQNATAGECIQTHPGASNCMQCVHDPWWHCPGWQVCTEEYGDCSTSKCCHDDGFGCHKRPFLHYAQWCVSPLNQCVHLHLHTHLRRLAPGAHISPAR